jgi:hypothetical protein
VHLGTSQRRKRKSNASPALPASTSSSKARPAARSANLARTSAFQDNQRALDANRGASKPILVLMHARTAITIAMPVSTILDAECRAQANVMFAAQGSSAPPPGLTDAASVRRGIIRILQGFPTARHALRDSTKTQLARSRAKRARTTALREVSTRGATAQTLDCACNVPQDRARLTRACTAAVRALKENSTRLAARPAARTALLASLRAAPAPPRARPAIYFALQGNTM